MSNNLLLRRHNLLSKKQNNVYTELEYIKCTTAGQYIVLDYKPNNKTKIIMEAKKDSNGGRGFVYGADNKWGVNNFSLYYGYQGQSSLIAAWGNYAQANDAINVSSLTDINITKFYNKELYFNDNLVYTNLATIENFQCSSNLAIFGNNRNNSVLEKVKNVYFYSMKLYEDDNLLYNLIPILDDNNIPCLLNTLNNNIYYNEIETPFEYA